MSEELKLCGCPFGCPKPVTLSDYTDKPRGAWLLAHRCDVVGPLFVEGYSGEQLAAAWNQRATPHLDVDQLANIIRAVDGDNTMGAGELAEAIVTSLEGYDHVED